MKMSITSMSLRLILMRHAKSSWKLPAATDHERPLNKRGRRDAPRIAVALDAIGWRPDVVLTSDSRRTLETFRLMSEQWDGDVRVETLRDFYLGGVDEIRAGMALLTSQQATAMALGHNPGWTEAVYWLTGCDEEMTTANAALLSHEGDDWTTAVKTSRQWRLHQVLRPREMSDGAHDT
jgi:phosphohistidine phosphatase